MRTLRCQHFFHACQGNCLGIDRWLMDKDKCPLCQQGLDLD
ncbi:MAG: RING finger protein [Planctomycetota bacterium]